MTSLSYISIFQCFVLFFWFSFENMKIIENPILCMDELSKLFALMEAQETRLHGIAHCIVPKEEEIPIIESVFVPPNDSQTLENKDEKEDEKVERPIPPTILQALMPIQTTKQIENVYDDLQTNSEKSMVNAPSDMPSLILSSLKNSVTATVTDQAIKEIIITTTESPVPNPDDNNIDIIAHTEKSIEPIESSLLTTIPATVPLIVDNGTVHNNTLENMTTVLETTPSPNLKSSTLQTTELPDILPSLSTSPSIAEIVLGPELETVSKSPEPDNYIYETFSPISPVNTGAISSLQRNEHLVLPEEPPEIPNVAVPAA